MDVYREVIMMTLFAEWGKENIQRNNMADQRQYLVFNFSVKSIECESDILSFSKHPNNLKP